RTKVRILKGTVQDNVDILFETRGEHGNWWISDDARTIYVTAEWLDWKLEEEVRLNPPKVEPQLYFFTMHKSTDGGQTFKQLDWPSDRSLGMVLFAADGRRGYAFNSANTNKPELWQTADGGESWHEVAIPAPYHQKVQPFSHDFDTLAVNDDGTLWMSMLVRQDGTVGSLLYRVPWQPDLRDLSKAEPYHFIPAHRVTDLVEAGRDEVLLNTMQYAFTSEDPVAAEKAESYFMYLKEKQILNKTNFGRKLYLG
ncbi:MULTISPECIES: hypothetical protein, partial [unclassified Neisseria]|uniref:WD40/YVTN/BNR-like repeat-containing protein n=1 Tax=unclassified Neisseria TaxID=2623750 RepID=UPI0026654746